MRVHQSLSIRYVEKIVIFDITGYLTEVSETILTEAYIEADMKRGGKLLLNFERRSFITSSGFGGIIKLLWKVRDKEQVLRVAHPSKQVRDIFNTIGLTQSIGVFASEEEALKDF